MEAGDLAQLSDEFIEGIMSNELFQGQGDLYMEEDNSNEPDDVIILHMDIRQTLRTLQKLIERKTGVNLKGYKFWLQDAQELEPHKNLVDQCVKGEGLVQINVQIQTINQRINIVDVLKPTEAALAALAAEEPDKHADGDSQDSNSEPERANAKTAANKIATYRKEVTKNKHADDSQDSSTETEHKANSKSYNASKDKPVLNWVLDNKFKKEQARLKIPEDPNDWTVPQVKHWFQWAVRQFDLIDANMSDWAITGKELCSLTHEEFRLKLPIDPGNVFWTHLQLLKECKFVSVVHKALEDGSYNQDSHHRSKATGNIASNTKELKIMRKSTFHSVKNYSCHNEYPPSSNSNQAGVANSSYGVGSGNNGQVQLWQFLLEILTDREHTNIIQWVGTEGEFKLSDPERVARLWGEKKNKPAMNYEKLSRALRYYYDGDMISKVPGKRFAYKFDCDLKLLIGYDAAELSDLVNEKSYKDEASMYLEHMKMQSDDE